VFSTIQETIKRVDTQKGARTVKRIHTDNGGEFLSNANQEWIRGQGIDFTTNAAHTPEHNSLAERAIKTIVSSARCMLIASGLSTHQVLGRKLQKCSSDPEHLTHQAKWIYFSIKKVE